jgi:hypothetical protein
MSKQLSVKVMSRKSGDEEWYEATVSVPGLKPTKLARKTDGNTKFPTNSSVKGAAKSLAKNLGFDDVDYGQKAAKPSLKKAAKKKPVVTTPDNSVSATPSV